MKKRVLSLIIALILPITLLCGCDSKTESDTSLPISSAVTPEQSESTPESSESKPEQSESTHESSASKPEQSESTPESSESKSEPTASTPAETNAELQTYYDEMIANYYEYTSGSTAGNSPEGCLKTANAQTAGLKKFAAMTVPKEYADRHSEMMSAAESEQEWRDVMYDYGNGVIDAESFQKKFKELFPTGVNRSEFTTKCLGIIADLNHEAGVVPTDEGKFLEMLSKI